MRPAYDYGQWQQLMCDHAWAMNDRMVWEQATGSNENNKFVNS